MFTSNRLTYIAFVYFHLYFTVHLCYLLCNCREMKCAKIDKLLTNRLHYIITFNYLKSCRNPYVVTIFGKLDGNKHEKSEILQN